LGLVGILLLGGIIAFNLPETQKSEMQMEEVVDKDKMMGTDKMMEKTITVALVAQNGSGEMGTAVLSEMGTQTRVMVNLTGTPTGVSQPMHIHGGACPKPGAVLYPLTNAIDGISETVLDVSLSKILGELPLAINVHKSATEAKVFVSCGNIAASPMEGGEKMMDMEDSKMMSDEKKMMPAVSPTTPTPAPTVAMVKTETMMKEKGSYVLYDSALLSRAENGRVVLFFRASWCPSCKALDSDIRARASEIPGDVTILNVDYDTHADLKQKYGVTYQHTLVQVDGKGNLIKKWSGTSKLSDLIAQLK